jgi:hypothetical protein
VPAVFLDGNTLNIVGSTRADRVQVFADARAITVIMTGGAQDARHSSSPTRPVVFRGLAGNDRFANNTSVACEVYGAPATTSSRAAAVMT